MHKVYLFFIFLLFPAIAAAGPSYECEMKATNRAGWISGKLYFEMVEEKSYVNVIDGYIYHIYGDTIRAKIVEKTDKRMKFTWDVEGIELSNRRLRVDAAYTATYYPGEAKLRMRVNLQAMDMAPPTGVGKCKPYEG